MEKQASTIDERRAAGRGVREVPLVRRESEPVQPDEVVAGPKSPWLLTDEPGATPRLLLADRSRPDWSRELDVGGATIDSISLLADRQRVAAITSDGSLRIYRLPERP